MITRYREYLKFIDERLSKMFDEQKPFIKCKKGCAYCCKEGEYPMSELEYVNLMFQYETLDDEKKQIIQNNISELLKKNRPKYYICPFLINNECSVYPSRAIICRAFGLLSFNEKGKKKVPFCVDLGLNYSNVYDKEQDKIVSFADDGTEPVAHNIERSFLRSQNFEKEFNIFFGEDKTLYEWLEEDFGEVSGEK